MSNCQDCGAYIEPDDRYCPDCGAPVDRVTEQHAHGEGGGGGGQRARTAEPSHGRGGARAQPGGSGFEGSAVPGKGFPRRPVREDTDVIGERIGAQIIDNIVSMVGALLIAFVFAAIVGGIGPESAEGIAAIGVLVAFGFFVFYHFFLEGYWDGYTVGKKVTGIKVVKEDGSSCSYGASFARNLLDIVDGFFYYAIGFIFMAMGDKRQRLGDRLASTVVVKEEPQGRRGGGRRPPAGERHSGERGRRR